MTIVQKIAILALPTIFAITMHEVAHGYVANLFGDHTARLSGRLSLNPLKHIDLIGSIIVPVLMLMVSNFIFGWAKPVPVDARNLHHPRRDMAFVALAGPLANILMAFFWGFVAKLGSFSIASGNVWLGVPLTHMGVAGIVINVFLGVFNLIPIPPLDGGRVLSSILPPRLAYKLSFIEPYTFFILILILVSGLFNTYFVPYAYALASLIASVFGLS